MAATKGPGELPVVQHRVYIEKTSKGDRGGILLVLFRAKNRYSREREVEVVASIPCTSDALCLEEENT
eukprot:2013-Heterococcus_DN1.PRE.1